MFKFLNIVRLLACALVVATINLGSPANSADIRFDGSNIIIKGEIKTGDDGKFKRIVEQLERPPKPIDGVTRPRYRNSKPRPVIYLRSNGGNTYEAIRIGQLINQKRYKTYAYRGKCLSACGLIWLAGRERIIHPKARVGFHNSYDGKTRRAQGNAMVGMYLGYLGYSYDTALFVTKSNHRNITYLSRERYTHGGISYDVRSLAGDKSHVRVIATPRIDPRKTRIILTSGESYNGDLVDGLPMGHGSITYDDKSSYRGHWKNGKRHGFGEFWDINGNYFKGTWMADSRHGFFQRISKSGSKSKSFWENGTRVNSSDFKTPKPWVVKLGEFDDHHKVRTYREKLVQKHERIFGLVVPYVTSEQNMVSGKLTNRRYFVQVRTFKSSHAKFLCEELNEANEKCSYFKETE